MWTRLLQANHLANRQIDQRFLLAAFVLFWPWVGWKLAKLGWRFRRSTLVLAAALAVYLTWGLWVLVGGAAALVLVPLAVGVGFSARFRCELARVARTGWRKWMVYLPRWPSLMRKHALVKQADGSAEIARLRDVDAGPDMDRLTIGIPVGMAPGDFEQAGDALAHATGAHECRVTVSRPGEVQVQLRRRDPLNRPVPLPSLVEDVDLRAVPIGQHEDRTAWTVPVLGSHLLCAGLTGAGKGSVLWSTLRALAPAIRAGLVRVTGIDPKGGMELAFGAGLFDQFLYRDWDAMAGALEEKADRLDERADRLRGATRQHTPTVEEPLELIVVDELLNLAALSPRKIQNRVEEASSRVLSMGRAPGFVLHGYTQDVTKDVLAFRDLFPDRIALRLATSTQVEMVLGDGMWDAGAACDRISPALPGVGYIRREGSAEPARVRATYTDDDTIGQLAAHYAPAPAPVGSSEARSEPVAQPA